jgi:hypothetical protein
MLFFEFLAKIDNIYTNRIIKLEVLGSEGEMVTWYCLALTAYNTQVLLELFVHLVAKKHCL